MKLLDNLYSIIGREETAGKEVFEISLNPDAEIYRGHFPGNPITPGVVMIRIAAELLSIIIDREVKLAEVTNIKYLSVISPLENQSVSYIFDKIVAAGDAYSVQVSVTGTDVLFSKMSLKFKLS